MLLQLEGKDVAEGAEQVLHEVKKKGEQVYHAACDACHNVSQHMHTTQQQQQRGKRGAAGAEGERDRT